MLEESLGRNERRATTVVVSVLVVETIWAFLHKYLPLDSGLWALQVDLVHAHLSGHVGDGWKLIPYPSANILLPLIGGVLKFLFSAEITTRLLQCVIGILLRGLAALALLRVLRVRDEGVYYLIPVLVFNGVWFSGAIPYMAGETVLMGTIALLLSQNHPRSGTYALISIGFAITALFHALALVPGLLVLIFLTQEQRRSVHLSQGWLSSPRAVLGLMLPAAVIVALSFLAGSPIFTISRSGFLPRSGFALLRFLGTPVPTVLEGILRGTNIFQILIAVGFLLIVLGFAARAYLLGVEEVTWQSRTVKAASYVLILVILGGIWLSEIGFDAQALIGVTLLLLLGGSYSRGPAVRRTTADRILLTASITAMVVAGLFNSFLVNRGSEAATEAVKRARALALDERQFVRTDERLDTIAMTMVLDSGLAQAEAGDWVGTFSYSLCAPIYLFSSSDVLRDPSAFQPQAGAMRRFPNPIVVGESSMGEPSSLAVNRRNSPTEPLKFDTPLAYVDPRLRVLSLLPAGKSSSKSFGPYELNVQDTVGGPFDWGEAHYRIVLGKLVSGPVSGMASR